MMTDKVGDNKERTVLYVRTGLLPALADALALARNTAMMCNEPRCKDLFEELRKAVLEIAPVHSEHFDGGKWSEAAAAATAGELVSVTVVGEDCWWDPDRERSEIVIAVDVTRCAPALRVISRRRFTRAVAERIAAEIHEHFSMLAPLET